MGFGRGTHFCLGVLLARLELPIAVGVFLDLFPGASLVDPAPDTGGRPATSGGWSRW